MHQTAPSVGPARSVHEDGAGGHAPRTHAEGKDLKKQLKQLETQLVLEALKVSDGHQRRAARWLGVSPTNLNARMKRLGICIERVLTYADGGQEDRIAHGLGPGGRP